ncbi:hypothetical protein H4219_000172 [Mycoemilia scoparia]|uniref:Uncharacterized protein n=1 Tax=Mycoemilia scoparia TaxID=417184 RepID=A0A9W8A434_9FUNG|nr:hypothetical protein H4219_000172 [Mycoemilia scoparia]
MFSSFIERAKNSAEIETKRIKSTIGSNDENEPRKQNAQQGKEYPERTASSEIRKRRKRESLACVKSETAKRPRHDTASSGGSSIVYNRAGSSKACAANVDDIDDKDTVRHHEFQRRVQKELLKRHPYKSDTRTISSTNSKKRSRLGSTTNETPRSESSPLTSRSRPYMAKDKLSLHSPQTSIDELEYMNSDVLPEDKSLESKEKISDQMQVVSARQRQEEKERLAKVERELRKLKKIVAAFFPEGIDDDDLQSVVNGDIGDSDIRNRIARIRQFADSESTLTMSSGIDFGNAEYDHSRHHFGRFPYSTSDFSGSFSSRYDFSKNTTSPSSPVSLSTNTFVNTSPILPPNKNDESNITPDKPEITATAPPPPPPPPLPPTSTSKPADFKKPTQPKPTSTTPMGSSLSITSVEKRPRVSSSAVKELRKNLRPVSKIGKSKSPGSGPSTNEKFKPPFAPGINKPANSVASLPNTKSDVMAKLLEEMRHHRLRETNIKLS